MIRHRQEGCRFQHNNTITPPFPPPRKKKGFIAEKTHPLVSKNRN
jgi:hypothetical protein